MRFLRRLLYGGCGIGGKAKRHVARNLPIMLVCTTIWERLLLAMDLAYSTASASVFWTVVVEGRSGMCRLLGPNRGARRTGGRGF